MTVIYSVDWYFDQLVQLLVGKWLLAQGNTFSKNQYELLPAVIGGKSAWQHRGSWPGFSNITAQALFSASIALR